jgi:formiminotetrahydrofolate cyclodeaminase
MSEHDFRTPGVGAFLDALGSAAPTPGGGTGAAVAGAMGAALVGMLARLTVGRKRYADHEKLMEAVAEQAAQEQGRLMDLAAQDAEAYDGVGRAMKLPRATDEEKEARREALQAALRGACDVPLQVMERCLEVLALAKTAVLHGNVNAVSDGAAGAELARAAMRVASYNVRINLASLKDESYVRSAQARMDEIEGLGAGASAFVDSHVRDLWSAKA